MIPLVPCDWIADRLGVSRLTLLYYLFHLQCNHIATDEGLYVSSAVAEELILFTCSKFGLNPESILDELRENYKPER